MEWTTVNHLFMDHQLVPTFTPKIHKKDVISFPSYTNEQMRPYDFILCFDQRENEISIMHISHLQPDGTFQYDNWGFQNPGLYSLKAVFDLYVYLPSFLSSPHFSNHRDIALYIQKYFA